MFQGLMIQALMKEQSKFKLTQYELMRGFNNGPTFYTLLGL